MVSQLSLNACNQMNSGTQPEQDNIVLLEILQLLNK